MTREEIDELMHRHPFQPFVIRLSSEDRCEVKDIGLAALMHSQMVIAFPNSDKRAIVPYLHIASIETDNGGARKPTRRRLK